MAAGFLSAMWTSYQWRLVHRPYATNALTASTIAFFGDIMAQTIFRDISGQPRVSRCYLEEHHIPTNSRLQLFSGGATDSVLDLRRSFIFASFTVVFGTPFWLRIYKSMDKAIPLVTPLTAIQKGMMSWVAANTTTPFFIAYLTVLDRWVIHKKPPQWRRGGDVSDGSAPGPDGAPTQLLTVVRDKVVRDMPVMMSYSICFWSVQWIPMFYLLPPHFRLVYGSMLQIAWSGITSYLLHRSDAPQAPPTTPEVGKRVG